MLRLIVGQGLRLAGVGIVLGIAGAFAVTPAVQRRSTTRTTDPVSFSVVAVFLLLVTLTASYIRLAGRWPSIR